VPTLNIGINTGQPQRVAPTVWDIMGFFNSPKAVRVPITAINYWLDLVDSIFRL